MGLILADALLMLSHGEAVKAGAGDVEIDTHQYKQPQGKRADFSSEGFNSLCRRERRRSIPSACFFPSLLFCY